MQPLLRQAGYGCAYVKIDPAADRAVIVMNNYDAGTSLHTLFTQSAQHLLALRQAR